MKTVIKAAALGIASVLAFSSVSFAGNAPAEEAVLNGHYIENYAQSSHQVDLSTVSGADLLYVAQIEGTRIFDFQEDGKCRIFDEEGVSDGTFELKDSVLSIKTDDEEKEYSFESVDGLLIIKDGDESSVLYGFDADDLDKVSIADYSQIEIDSLAVQVSDSNVETYINSVLQGSAKYERVTQGTVSKGDIITISFEGVLEGQTEPFEGGSGEGVTLQLGSGALIDGFEDQLEGQEIGTEFQVKITFPEDYSTVEGLAGKNAVFTTKILNKTVVTIPELTDEWVQEFSEKYLPEKLETAGEFVQFSRDYLERFMLHSAMLNALAAKTSVTEYNGETARMLAQFFAKNLADTAALYGYDEATFIAANGFATAEEYEQSQAISYMNISLISGKILEDLGVYYTEEEFNNALDEYLRMSASPYDTEEFLENADAADKWIFANLEFKYNLAMDKLEDRVVLKESAAESAQEGTGESTLDPTQESTQQSVEEGTEESTD